MSESIIRDNYFLLYSLLLGIAVTILYDMLRIFRRVVKHGNALVSLEDFLYWIVVAICVFYMMHEENNGTLRWFAVLGAAVGMLLYKKLVSRLFVDSVVKMLRFVLKILGKILHVLFTPVRFLLRIFGKGAKNARIKGSKGLRFLKKKLTKSLKALKMVLCKQ